MRHCLFSWSRLSEQKSASISGASAGVRPPRGAEEDRSRLDPGCGRQGSNVGDGDCTTRFENAHRTVFREVLYRHHPWFGRRVCVHGTVDKADDVVFRCSLDGSRADRWLEVPAWMFDRTACLDAELLTAHPFVSITALAALSALLDLALKDRTPSAALVCTENPIRVYRMIESAKL